jgi:hypothetical protein
MTNVTAVVTQLQEQRGELNSQLSRLDQAIQALSGFGGVARAGRTGKRRMSAPARARIAAAQRKRWAKWKKTNRAA